MTDQLGLSFDPALSRVEREYREWRASAEGRRLFAEALRRALRLVGSRVQHFGIAAIWESMRFDAAVEAGPDAAGFKLNNNHRAYLARDLMAADPRLADFFETRTLHGRHFERVA